MTPTHQRLIDSLLQKAARRTYELQTGINGTQPPREVRLDDLRTGPLGQHLANLANYSEGYNAAGDIREAAQFVGRFFFGDAFHDKRTFRFPEKFHQTDLGKLVNEAVLRFYEQERPGQLLTMAEMRDLFGVTRQTVHQWIRAGQITPVYINNTSRFYRKDVERLRAAKEKH
jgi:Helix-turn-helix domain